MSQFKSKAEARRAEWLTRQYAAEQATVLGAVKDELRADEMQTVIAAAERAVKDAAMEWWHKGWQGVEYKPLSDACAALAKLEDDNAAR